MSIHGELEQLAVAVEVERPAVGRPERMRAAVSSELIARAVGGSGSSHTS